MRRLSAAIAVAVALASAAGAQAQAPVGIGLTAQPGSAQARGIAAYFAYVNARGGLRGVPLAIAQGPSGLTAVLDTEGIDPRVVRLSAPLLRIRPSARLEAEAIARHAVALRSDASLAVLTDETSRSASLLTALRRALGRRGQELAVDSSLAELRATRADVLFNLTARAVKWPPGWRPQVYATSSAAGTPAPGTIAPAFVKEPSDPRWLRDRGLDPFRPLSSAAYVVGLAAAFTLIEALARAGPGAASADVALAFRSVNVARNPFVLPGLVLRTGPRDTEVVGHVALQRFDGRRWSAITGLVSLR